MGDPPGNVPQPFPYTPGGRPGGGFRLYGGHGLGHGFEHHGGGHHWISLLLFVLLVAALIVLAISAARLAFRRPKVDSTAGEDDALGTLRMRYARGEIGRDDFLLAHADLGGTHPPPEAAR